MIDRHSSDVSLAEAAPGTRSSWLRVSSLLLSRGILAIGFGAVALFLPLVRADLGLSFSEAGALSSFGTLVYAAMQVPAGQLADRYGPRPVLLAGFLGTSALTLVFAFVQSFAGAVVVQSLFGFFRALVFAPGLVLIARWFPDDRRSTALGISVAANFGFTMLLNAVGPWLAELVGWRAIFAGSAVAGLLAAGAFMQIADDPGHEGGAGRRLAGERLRDLLARPDMWSIGGIQFARLGIVASTAFWMPSFLVEEHAFRLETAGAIVALGAAATALANLLGGYLADRTGRPLFVVGTSLTALAGTSTLLATVQGSAALVAVVVLHAIFVQAYFAPLFALPVSLMKVRNEGLATGLGNLFANLGALSFAFTIGALKDVTGSFSAGFLALAGVAGIGALLSIQLARSHRAASIS